MTNNMLYLVSTFFYKTENYAIFASDKRLYIFDDRSFLLKQYKGLTDKGQIGHIIMMCCMHNRGKTVR